MTKPRLVLAKIARLNHDITLEDEQSDEVSQIMQTIERQQALKELNKVLQEGSLGPTAQKIWNEDKRKTKSQFYKDQQQNCKAKNFLIISPARNYWKETKLIVYTITIRIGIKF